jgi:hypothetical protein
VPETSRLPIEDAADMPVTPDLSVARQAKIQAWIEHGCPERGSEPDDPRPAIPVLLGIIRACRSAHVVRLLLGELEGRSEVAAALIDLADLDRSIIPHRLGEADAAPPGAVGRPVCLAVEVSRSRLRSPSPRSMRRSASRVSSIRS